MVMVAAAAAAAVVVVHGGHPQTNGARPNPPPGRPGVTNLPPGRPRQGAPVKRHLRSTRPQGTSGPKLAAPTSPPPHP